MDLETLHYEDLWEAIKMRISRRQLRKLVQEVFKKGLPAKAIRRISGLGDEMISTLEDLEGQGPEYRQQAQQLARDLGSLEPESIYYDMNQPDTNNQTLAAYKLEIYNFLDSVHAQYGPFNDRHFVLFAHIKKYMQASMYKMEEIKLILALQSLVKDGLIKKKTETAWDIEQTWTEAYYGIK